VTLDVSGLNRVLLLDGEQRRVEVQAATPWSALGATLPGTVGEAVSANAPGPDGVPVVSHVEAITLVTPDGEVRRADRHAHSDCFALAVGGYGLAGVLYSVTLRIDSLARSIKDAGEAVVLELAEPGPGAPRSAEFLVPPEHLEAVLERFKDFAAERRIALERISVRRLQPERETLLRWATREWAQVTLRYNMRTTLSSCVHANEIEARLLDTVLAAGGSFRIGEWPDASVAQLRRCYPKLAEFIARKKRLDPAERLQSGWYRRAVAPSL
jgi:FAD binding domain-containing protein